MLSYYLLMNLSQYDKPKKKKSTPDYWLLRKNTTFAANLLDLIDFIFLV